VPKGPSDSRHVDPALGEALFEGLWRFKNGHNPERKVLSNKELSKILSVSEPQVSQILKDSRRAGKVSANTLAAALRAGVSVGYDHIELTSKRTDLSTADAQPEHLPTFEQICFTFETGFECEESPKGLTVSRKGPASSSALRVQVKVG
jgi:hypothetical protein